MFALIELIFMIVTTEKNLAWSGSYRRSVRPGTNTAGIQVIGNSIIFYWTLECVSKFDNRDFKSSDSGRMWKVGNTTC